MTVRGIIFDLFHTLTGLESGWSVLPWTSDVLGVDRTLWDEALSRSRWRLTAECDPYHIVSRLARELDPSIGEDRIQEALQVRTQRFKHALTRVPEQNIRTLEHLRKAGLRLGLISNCDSMEVAAWNESPLPPLFDAAIFSCTAGCMKPEPAIYRRGLDSLGLAPEECLFVGDGGSDELSGAKSVGLRTVFISGVVAELWPERVEQRLAIADHHIERIPEILSIIDLATPAMMKST